jgi:hypothetical protein
MSNGGGGGGGGVPRAALQSSFIAAPTQVFDDSGTSWVKSPVRVRTIYQKYLALLDHDKDKDISNMQKGT